MTNGFFSLFVLSVYGVMGKDTQVVLATLSQIMATKMDETILHVKSWVNGQIAIAVARSYSQVLRGAQFPIPLHTLELEWALGSGLGLVQ